MANAQSHCYQACANTGKTIATKLDQGLVNTESELFQYFFNVVN